MPLERIMHLKTKYKWQIYEVLGNPEKKGICWHLTRRDSKNNKVKTAFTQ